MDVNVLFDVQVLLSIAVMWLLCYILTVTDALPEEPHKWGHVARTDTQGDAIDRAPWFRFPYPGMNSKLCRSKQFMSSHKVCFRLSVSKFVGVSFFYLQL